MSGPNCGEFTSKGERCSFEIYTFNIIIYFMCYRNAFKSYRPQLF